jgi:ArsR family transcriptional regulator
MDELATTFKALSDKTRLQIITLLLLHDELCVCDFVEALGLTQSKTSRHLRYLYHSGLVADRRDGLWMHYRLHPRLTAAQRRIIEALAEAVTPEQKRELEEHLQAWLRRKQQAEASSDDPQAGERHSAVCC